MKRILVLFSSILVAGVCLFFLILKSNKTKNQSGTKEPQAFCGTKGLKEEASLGKQLFYANCAACHKLDKKMTGPTLRDIRKKYGSMTIRDYLRGDKSKIESKDYNMSCLIFRTLSDEDISNIISYTDSN